MKTVWKMVIIGIFFVILLGFISYCSTTYVYPKAKKTFGFTVNYHSNENEESCFSKEMVKLDVYTEKNITYRAFIGKICNNLTTPRLEIDLEGPKIISAPLLIIDNHSHPMQQQVDGTYEFEFNASTMTSRQDLTLYFNITSEFYNTYRITLNQNQMKGNMGYFNFYFNTEFLRESPTKFFTGYDCDECIFIKEENFENQEPIIYEEKQAHKRYKLNSGSSSFTLSFNPRRKLLYWIMQRGIVTGIILSIVTTIVTGLIVIPWLEKLRRSSIIGNKNGKKYHRKESCINRIQRENRRRFNDRDSAEIEDYIPCQTCYPTRH